MGLLCSYTSCQVCQDCEALNSLSGPFFKVSLQHVTLRDEVMSPPR